MTSYDGSRQYYSKNADLFWPLRGGGGSTWGVVTAITVKTHKPINECSTGCYTKWTIGWYGHWDDGNWNMLVNTYLKWTASASKHWGSYASLVPNSDLGGDYIFYIFDTLYVGTEEDGDDYWSLDTAME